MMQIYFLRHGIAADHAPDGMDRSRALTPEGIAHLQEQARGMHRLEITIDLLLTSPYVRARQTAEIVGPALGREPTVELALSSGMTSTALLAVLAQYAAQRIMIVGHEPDLSIAISHFTGGGRVNMKKGSLALVEVPYADSTDGVLQWLLSPKIVRALGKG